MDGWMHLLLNNTVVCFSFEVNGIFLKNALRRFADCFIAPLLARKRLKSEVKARTFDNSKFWTLHRLLSSSSSGGGTLNQLMMVRIQHSSSKPCRKLNQPPPPQSRLISSFHIELIRLEFQENDKVVFSFPMVQYSHRHGFAIPDLDIFY
ncbi:nardilysin [Trifolium repens]|nr:nardilysin [Trifolium repens]